MNSNIPHSFLEQDLWQFEQWLSTSHTPYFVCLRDGEVVACGGYSIDPQSIGWLRWGLVRRDCQRSGIGSFLLEERFNYLARQPLVLEVRVATSQHSEGFFRHHGFRILEWLPNRFGPGYDRVELSHALGANAL